MFTERTRIGLDVHATADETCVRVASSAAGAHARTHQMQVMIVALTSGPAALASTLGREPTTAELLRYVGDEVAAKSRPFGPPAGR